MTARSQRRGASRTRALVSVAGVALTIALVAACTSDDKGSAEGGSTTTTLAPGTVTTTTPDDVASTLLTSTDGYLLAIDASDADHNQFISVTAPTDPNDPASPSVDLDVHDQACFIGGTNGRFAMPIAPGPGVGTVPTWGIFQLAGAEVGSFAVSLVTTLDSPSYQSPTPESSARPYGCASLSDGRIVTTDLGTDGAPNGQLTVWFGPFDRATAPKACKIDTELAEPRGVWVDEQDRVIVASSGAPTTGVWRYSRIPTSADAAGGCGAVDAVGAPLADTVRKDSFIAAGDHGLTAPSGITGSVDHGILVSSALSGTINEYDANGEFKATIVSPEPGESLDEASTYFTGTPLGMAIDVDGTLFYADPGWVVDRTGAPLSPEISGLIQSLDLATPGSGPDLFIDSLTDPTSLTIFRPSGGREGSPL